MIHLDEKAIEWFKDELDLEGQAVRFYVRYGGDVQLKQGFSPAFTVESPDNDALVKEQSGLTYFIDEKDLWYYEDNQLNVSVADDEITYEIAS